jgi:hypothetical protein
MCASSICGWGEVYTSNQICDNSPNHSGWSVPMSSRPLVLIGVALLSLLSIAWGIAALIGLPGMQYEINEIPVSREQYRALDLHRMSGVIFILLGLGLTPAVAFPRSRPALLGVYLLALGALGFTTKSLRGIRARLAAAVCVVGGLFLLSPFALALLDRFTGTSTGASQDVMEQARDGLARWSGRISAGAIGGILAGAYVSSTERGRETRIGCLPFLIVVGAIWWLITGRPGIIFGPPLHLYHEAREAFSACVLDPQCWLSH